MRNPSLVILLVGVSAFAGCNKAKDEGKKPPAVSAPVVVVDAGSPPIDAVAIDAGPLPLTPAVPAGKVGLQVIDLEYGGIVASGLPAIKGDGSAVVALSSADDGGRGYLDLEVLFLDGTNAVTKKLRIADPDVTSADEVDPDSAKTATRTAVDAAAIAKVAELNAELAVGDWRPLQGTAPLQRSDSMDYTNEIPLGDLTYKLDVGKRVLTLARAGKVVATHKLGTIYKVAKGGGDEMCGGDQPFLTAVFSDAVAGKAVIQIAFIPGGHNCGSGGDVYAVVPLPT